MPKAALMQEAKDYRSKILSEIYPNISNASLNNCISIEKRLTLIFIILSLTSCAVLILTEYYKNEFCSR